MAVPMYCASGHNSASAAVLACVGQALRCAWIVSPQSDHVISADSGMLLSARACAPHARAVIAIIRDSAVRVVVPDERSVITSTSGPGVWCWY